MNKLIYLILGAILISCSQSKMDNDSPSKFYGEWILVNVSGGITGEIRDIDTETDKHILVLEADNTISYSHNNALISSSKYRIEKRKGERIQWSNYCQYWQRRALQCKRHCELRDRCAQYFWQLRYPTF